MSAFRRGFGAVFLAWALGLLMPGFSVREGVMTLFVIAAVTLLVPLSPTPEASHDQ